MKYFYLLLFTIVVTFKMAAQCPTSKLFNRQSQIDNFKTDYPGCTDIPGTVRIKESLSGDIVDLSGLDQLNSVGALEIIGNFKLSNLDGLSSLSSISTRLILQNNSELSNIDGLSSLASTGQEMWILNNHNLPNLDGLSSISSIGNSLAIENNSSLTNIDGLAGLNTVGYYVEIYNNSSLLNVDGLLGLNSIGGELAILRNNSLSDISGVENIDANSITKLKIKNNSSLSICEEQSICDFLNIPGSISEIKDNAPGCNSRAEVENKCNGAPPSCTTLSNPLDGDVNVDITTDLSWDAVADADGYRLDVGTTPGGTDIEDNTDVGNVTTYDPGDFPCNSTIYVTITPYNASGDATGCAEESFETEYVEITGSLITNATCYQEDDGAIDITVSSGSTPLSFAWDNGETTEDISGLVAGTYCVTVSTSNGCSDMACYTITEPDVLEISNATLTHLNCYQSGDGAIDITVVGGTPFCSVIAWPSCPPGYSYYEYLWDNGETTQDLSNLDAGTYCVTVTDWHGCETSSCYTITQPDSLAVSGTVSKVKCFGGSDGEIDITVQGGTMPYSYNWDNGATTEDLTGLTAGTYCVTVTDDHNCETSECYEVTEWPLLEITNSTLTNLTCFESGDGAIKITVVGGRPWRNHSFAYYTYDWSNGVHEQGKYGILTDLDAGTYCVTVTDVNNCTIEDCYTITEPDLLEISSANLTDLSCFESGDGAIDITVIGGTMPYNYVWDNGETTEDLSNLDAGTYCVTVTDANDCTVVGCYTIKEPDLLEISSSNLTNLRCFESGDGAIDITVIGGTMPYSYSWDNGATTEDISGLDAGTYCVTIVDSHGCDTSECFIITEPDELIISISHTDETGNEFEDGTASVSVQGGVMPYAYQWSNGATTATVTDLPPGIYSVIVTDAHGCTREAQVTIEKYICAYRSLIAAVSNVRCKGEENGKIDIRHVIRGEAPFQYEWSNGGDNIPTIWGLTPGRYGVSVTDSRNCTAEQEFVITEPEELEVHASTTDETAPNHNDGTATCNPTGGNYPYKFLWSTGEKTQSISQLAPGKYWVRIRDNFGCTATEVVYVNGANCPKPSYTVSHANVSCYGACDGVLQLAGPGTLKYLWNTGDTTAVLAQLCPGTYHVEITDPDGCGTDTGFVITQPDKITIKVKSTKLMGPGRKGNIILDYDADGDLTYSWTGPKGYSSQSPSINDLEDYGCYHLTVHNLTTGCDVDTTICLEYKPDVYHGDNPDHPIVIFPNPIIGEFTIDLRSTEIQTAEVALISLNGQVMWQAEKLPSTSVMHVAADQLKPGIYFLKVTEAGQKPVYKKVFVGSRR